MAFGLTKDDLAEWKEKASSGEVAFLTHYWIDDRFPGCKTVTKAACCDREVLIRWGRQYGLKPEWIDDRSDFPHFDLLGEKQVHILEKEGRIGQLLRLDHGKGDKNR